MYSVTGDTTSLVPGFPIRTSSDPRSVDSSPRHNAASHVLHRLPVPRHPPCALKHLQHKTIKNSRKNQKLHITTQNNTTPQTRRGSHPLHQMLATTIHKSNTTPHHQSRATTTNPKPYSGRHPTNGGDNLSPVSHTRDEEIAGLLSQSPIVCLAIPSPASISSIPVPAQRLSCTRPRPTTGERPSTESLQVALIRAMRAGLKSRGAP